MISNKWQICNFCPDMSSSPINTPYPVKGVQSKGKSKKNELHQEAGYNFSDAHSLGWVRISLYPADMWSSESIWDSLSHRTLNKSFQAASFINFSPVCGLQMIPHKLNSWQTFNNMSHRHFERNHTVRFYKCFGCWQHETLKASSKADCILRLPWQLLINIHHRWASLNCHYRSQRVSM